MTPEESRTKELFSLSVGELAKELQGRVVISEDQSTKVKFVSLEAWPKEKIGKRYQAMENMEPGTLWAYYFAFRQIMQTLIVAKDQEKSGACVRVLHSEGFKREGDTAKQLGLSHNETTRLAFRDQSELLYLEKITKSI